MALTERDMELVNLAAREAAFTAIRESDTNLRMMVREEASPVAKEAVKQHLEMCPVAADAREIVAQSRISMLKVIIIALVASGGTGALVKLPEIVNAFASIIK